MTITAQEIFIKEYRGDRNFMPPNVIRYGRKGEMAYELSSGEGFSGETIYGLTVVHYDSDLIKITKEHKLSGCHQSLGDAEEAIRKLPRFRCISSQG